MEDKSYKNFIEDDSEGFSLEEILAEFNTAPYSMPPEGGSLSDRSRDMMLDVIDEAGEHSSVDSIEEMVEQAVSMEAWQGEEEHPEEIEFSDEELYEEEGDSQPEILPEAENEPSLNEKADELPDGDQPMTEYEIRELLNADEREYYSSYDPDDDLVSEDEEEDKPEPSRRKGREKKKASKSSGKEKFLSPVVALLALATHKRSSRVQADDITATPDSEDENFPEMEPKKAAKFYESQAGFLKLRGKIALALSIVMLYITLAFDSFLPLFGAMKGATASSLVMLVMLLSVILCGLDVFTAGIMSLVRGRPNADSLVSVSCLMAAADALVIGLDNSGSMGLPFCAAAAISMSLSIWGAYFTCMGMRDSFRVMGSKRASAITAEKGINPKGFALLRSARGISGCVRRSELADLTEYVYNILTPAVIACALVFGALASFFNGRSDAFVHCVSTMLAVSAAFSAGICFSLPFAVTAKKLYNVGSAICGWGGVRDIGRSRNVVIGDSDIFPRDSVEISDIRVLEGSSADKVISYTGSVIAASGNGMAASFSAMLERNGYTLCKVENFEANDGGGMTAVVNGEQVMVGSTGFMNLMGIRVPQKIATRDTVFTAINGTLVGIFNINYKVSPATQDALGLLQRTRREPVFALRDFNISPIAIENKFHLPADKINFPSFSERFRISGLPVDESSPVAAVVCRDGMVPIVEMSERGAKLYLALMAGTAITAACAVVGLLAMFICCWMGSFGPATAAKACLWMLLSLIPQAGIYFWLKR